MPHDFGDRWNHNTHHYPRLARHVRPGDRVLDVGAGDGMLAAHLAGRGARAVALDVDASVLAHGRGTGTAVPACAGSAEALPFRDGTFDVLTMVATLHHLSAAPALAEVRRVLRPGGLLMVLGIAAYGGPRDLPAEVRDVLTHQVLSRLRTAHEPPTTRVEPALTWAQERAALRDLLPGHTYRRLSLWRSLTTWRKPRQAAA